MPVRPLADGATFAGYTIIRLQPLPVVAESWSIANPVVTSSPSAPLPPENESPVRICMQQTGHSRLRCADEILRGDAL